MLARALRAFHHRNFRLFFGGQVISLIGTWMQRVALSWLVYRLTDSAFALGLVSFMAQFPSFVLAPVGGVLADRWDRRRLVIVTQVLFMLQAGVLATLVLAGSITVWQIVVLAAILGTITGFDIPARQSLLVELVEGPEDLANAIALNSSFFNAARLIGPAIAGLLIGLVGEGLVFAADAVSYLAVLAGLFAIRLPSRPAQPERPPILRTLREGFGYAFGFPPIRAILVLLAMLSLLGMPYVVLMPIFASDILRGGPKTLGFLVSAAGLGALAGALYLAARSSVRGLGRVIVVSSTIFGVGLIAFALSRSEWLSALVLMAAGFGLMAATASSNTILQTIVDDDKRGRVMSLYTMAFMGMAPFGGLLAGVLASRIGASYTVLAGGVAVLAVAGWFARILPSLRQDVVPVYQRLGIIPEVAAGLESATEHRLKS
jgi:MFS family permease